MLGMRYTVLVIFKLIVKGQIHCLQLMYLYYDLKKKLILSTTFNHRVRGQVERLITLVQKLRMKIRKWMMMEGRWRLPLPRPVTQLPQKFRQLLCRHQSFTQRVRIICYSYTFRSHVYLHIMHKRGSTNITDFPSSLNHSNV